MKIGFGVLLRVPMFMVFTSTAAAQGTEMSWTVDGVERVALVFAPAAAHLTVPRAVIVIGGKSDLVLPFSDQEQAIEDARQADGATGPGQACGPGCTLYTSTSHTPVVTRIHPGGHVFPPRAAPAIVEFFKEHKHP